TNDGARGGGVDASAAETCDGLAAGNEPRPGLDNETTVSDDRLELLLLHPSAAHAWFDGAGLESPSRCERHDTALAALDRLSCSLYDTIARFCSSGTNVETSGTDALPLTLRASTHAPSASGASTSVVDLGTGGASMASGRWEWALRADAAA
ncbi:hypothetical protein LTR16_011855, partial [Cryomyces antarcticus]